MAKRLIAVTAGVCAAFVGYLIWRSLIRSENDYDPAFFREMGKLSTTSAAVVAPEMVKLLNPKSIVDVGGGTGNWLAEFRKLGIDDVLSIDGDWVTPQMLVIPPQNFKVHDLEKRLQENRKFDLALSLEVGEHLPPSRAETFVVDLTLLAPAVLFSAAIPQQGGTNHVNEQWQDYWAGFFDKAGFATLDCLRSKLWEDSRVAAYYRQNMILYVKRDALASYPGLGACAAVPKPQRLVHPQTFLGRAASDPTAGGVYRDLKTVTRRTIRSLFGLGR